MLLYYLTIIHNNVLILYYMYCISYNQIYKFHLVKFSTRNVILYISNTAVFIYIYTDNIHSVRYRLLTNIKNVSSLYYTQ